MVLRFTVMNSHFLREAVEAIPVDGLAMGMVMISWSPRYFGVESVPMVGNSPFSLLKLAPQSFTSFESTDTHFNAVIDYEQLRSVFRAAQDSDPIEFSHSFECDRIHTHGVLNARFNRPVNTGDSMNDIISMPIIDISDDPSPDITLVPVARLAANGFMVALRTSGRSVFISTQVGTEGREIEVVMSTPGERGVISIRNREEDEPIIRVGFDLQGLDLEGSAALSNEVALLKTGVEEELGLIWFRLDKTRTRLDGDIIHCLH